VRSLHSGRPCLSLPSVLPINTEGESTKGEHEKDRGKDRKKEKTRRPKEEERLEEQEKKKKKKKREKQGKTRGKKLSTACNHHSMPSRTTSSATASGNWLFPTVCFFAGVACIFVYRMLIFHVLLQNATWAGHYADAQ
jgi:Flp pilus assembly protein TadB